MSLYHTVVQILYPVEGGSFRQKWMWATVIGRVNLLVLVTRGTFLRGTRILGIFLKFRVNILEYIRVKF